VKAVLSPFDPPSVPGEWQKCIADKELKNFGS